MRCNVGGGDVKSGTGSGVHEGGGGMWSFIKR